MLLSLVHIVRHDRDLDGYHPVNRNVFPIPIPELLSLGFGKLEIVLDRGIESAHFFRCDSHILTLPIPHLSFIRQ